MYDDVIEQRWPLIDRRCVLLGTVLMLYSH
jgi:hypothetical protein